MASGARRQIIGDGGAPINKSRPRRGAAAQGSTLSVSPNCLKREGLLEASYLISDWLIRPLSYSLLPALL